MILEHKAIGCASLHPLLINVLVGVGVVAGLVVGTRYLLGKIF